MEFYQSSFLLGFRKPLDESPTDYDDTVDGSEIQPEINPKAVELQELPKWHCHFSGYEG